jgi:prophage antirepressor-like protein
MSKKSNNFYLDVFNKLISINEHKVFIIFDKNGNIWFNFKDLLTALGYENPKLAIQQLKINSKYLKKIDDLKGALYHNTPMVKNIQPHSNMINNVGLFMVLSRSRKDISKQFMEKYIEDIMPSIFTTGKYISNDKDMKRIKE